MERGVCSASKGFGVGERAEFLALLHVVVEQDLCQSSASLLNLSFEGQVEELAAT